MWPHARYRRCAAHGALSSAGRGAHSVPAMSGAERRGACYARAYRRAASGRAPSSGRGCGGGRRLPPVTAAQHSTPKAQTRSSALRAGGSTAYPRVPESTRGLTRSRPVASCSRAMSLSRKSHLQRNRLRTAVMRIRAADQCTTIASHAHARSARCSRRASARRGTHAWSGRNRQQRYERPVRATHHTRASSTHVWVYVDMGTRMHAYIPHEVEQQVRVVVDPLENVRVDLPAAERTPHRRNASRARDACSHAPSRTPHAAHRLALTPLLPHAALDGCTGTPRRRGRAARALRAARAAAAASSPRRAAAPPAA
jgi:hypothetical protein